MAEALGVACAHDHAVRCVCGNGAGAGRDAYAVRAGVSASLVRAARME